jgi:hypothetical protein
MTRDVGRDRANAHGGSLKNYVQSTGRLMVASSRSLSFRDLCDSVNILTGLGIPVIKLEYGLAKTSENAPLNHPPSQQPAVGTPTCCLGPHRGVSHRALLPLELGFSKSRLYPRLHFQQVPG